MTRKRYTSEQIIHKLREAEVELAPAARSTATTAVFSFDMAAKYRGVRLYLSRAATSAAASRQAVTPSTAAARKYSYVFHASQLGAACAVSGGVASTARHTPQRRARLHVMMVRIFPSRGPSSNGTKTLCFRVVPGAIRAPELHLAGF